MGDTLWDAVVAAWAPASSPSAANRHHQYTRAPVNRREQGQSWPLPFQPIVRAGIDLHEHPRLGIPFAPTAMRGRVPGARRTNACCPKNAAHARPREDDPFPLAQLLGQLHLIESPILARCQDDDRLPGLRVHGIRCSLPAIAMCQCRDPALPIRSEQSLDVPLGYAKYCRPLSDRYRPPINLCDHQTPLLFSLVQCHVLHKVTFSLNS